ncbi:MAG: adenylyltransferase/cytidyltransferase family protein [Phycisphaerales bacterium]|nr:adenylyltransferase/cytidyltransferase family protein [Phycisphaerales bacterium]
MSVPAAIATIGNFDGVHAGHRELVRRARRTADQRAGATVLAVVFDPHPATVLRPSQPPAVLSTFDQRRRWLTDLGVDRVLRLDPRKPVDGAGAESLLALSAEAFIEWLARVHGVAGGGIVEGPDFRFGKDRKGTVETLRSWAAHSGGSVEVVEPIDVTLPSGERVPARSGVARRLISAGRVADAAAVLGRPYEIEGTVVRGYRRGRAMGFPTLNIECEHLRPAAGVYAGWATLPDGQTAPAAVSVGVNATFNQSMVPTVEAHVLGVGGPGRLLADREYGWGVRLTFTHRLREMVRFDGVDALTAAISNDCAQVRALAAQTQTEDVRA